LVACDAAAPEQNDYLNFHQYQFSGYASESLWCFGCMAIFEDDDHPSTNPA